ncbi:MAG: hypothetical protein O3A65_00420 [Proteobacteria bacterium]|nr:hypothetical protein [Pseudomonadota bacterium]
MHHELMNKAAKILWDAWSAGHAISGLPQECRPTNRQSAYEIQKRIADLSQSAQIGWKIAATSENGQRHIGVSGPLAGRLLADRSKVSGDNLTLGANLMAVAEAEYCFRLGSDLPPREADYSVEEVLTAMDTLHPAIEIPDSRYLDFITAGEAQLIADNACASWFVLGPPTTSDWRNIELRDHKVQALVNGIVVAEGLGSNVLGDPRVALTWIANELSHEGIGLKSGEVITTGTCVLPFKITPGDYIRLDFRQIGQVCITLN